MFLVGEKGIPMKIEVKCSFLLQMQLYVQLFLFSLQRTLFSTLFDMLVQASVQCESRKMNECGEQQQAAAAQDAVSVWFMVIDGKT